MELSSFRFLDHTKRLFTVGRTPLDEWSARSRDLYLTTHDSHKGQTYLPQAEFETTVPASELMSQLRTLGHTSLSPREQLILHLTNRSRSRLKGLLVTVGPGSIPWPVRVEFAVDEVSRWQGFLRVLRFSHVGTITPTLHPNSYICQRCCIILAFDSVV